MKKLAYLFLAIAILGVSCKKDKDEDPVIQNLVINTDVVVPTTWKADKTIIIDGHIYVNDDLTIEPGAVIKFKEGSSLNIGNSEYGSMLAEGTAEKPILFTSYSANPSPGDWKYIYFGENNSSSRSSLKYCTIQYGGDTDYGMLHFYNTQIKLENTIIKNSLKNGVYAESDAKFFSCINNTISNCGMHAMDVDVNCVATISATNSFSVTGNYGIKVSNTELKGTVTWNKLDVPYFINDGLWLDAETGTAELTLAPGCVVKMGANQGIFVGNYHYAKLIANGTASEPITITSGAASPSAGDWSYVEFGTNNNAGSILNFCNISYGGNNTDYGIINVNYTSDLTISNCNISYSEGHGIYLYDASPVMSGNTFSNIAGEDVYTEPGK
ncbi:MAG: hypothetical protein JXR58_03825 [Bacteroidales bacterium]|nr:hypothetical protein [Bacteroidales bacterium]